MHPTAPSRPRAGLRVVLIVAVTAVVTAAVVAAAIIVLATGSEGRRTNISGSVTITDDDPTKAGFLWDDKPARCDGTDSYGDVAEGASVAVADEHGKVLAVAKLGPGLPGGMEKDSLGTRASWCAFPIVPASVPVRRFYRVTVGRHAPTLVSDLGHVRIRLNT